MKTRLREEELRAWQALLHAHRDVTRKLDAELRAQHGISFEAYDMLLRLARAPGHALRMSELAERVMAPPSTLTRRVDRLVSQGLVERDRIAHDSRGMLARLTPQGSRVVRRAAATHLRGIREHYTGRLTEEQLREVAMALEVITGPHRAH
ncbi:MAG: MarR family transcriptional regulator [Chloroflexota bacterium]|nr:MarR family transcriptional regulator [Chloroflexota bacterium]